MSRILTAAQIEQQFESEWVLVEDPKTKIALITVKDPAAPDPLITKIIQLKYAHPTNLVGNVQALFTDKRSKVVPIHGPRMARAPKMTIILGTNVSVASWICVTAWIYFGCFDLYRLHNDAKSSSALVRLNSKDRTVGSFDTVGTFSRASTLVPRAKAWE